ncbi:hypothetical protein [Allorhodopirellula solitaria]|uniref:Uncharacterized protein n=1 Tax=Allorhodopirellula solitaria TaxID=2527987 RepID=A0A5C5YG31_9BACT|nr:hypothetical protein [Allorhodopirellula solitaria]TWT74058.1 hypothetical protein CA85_09430 [Allorhodopirellula solitaria]
MNEPTKTDFVPRWARNATPEFLESLAETPVTGSAPLEWPRIVTRILPSSGSSSLGANTVSEVIELTQKLANYAAYDAVRGINPDFADMRSMGAELLAFSRLTIEPFEEGSFVIPARFESPDLIENDERESAISAERIANRFGNIFEDVGSQNASASISIGALQTIQQLNRTLNREASAIEFSTFDRYERRSGFQRVDTAFVKRVDSVVKNRQPSVLKMESLRGNVTALDIEKGELRLSVSTQKDRVKGTFPMMLHPTILESLGREIEVYGRVSFKNGRPESISIQQADILDSE